MGIGGRRSIFESPIWFNKIEKGCFLYMSAKKHYKAILIVVSLFLLFVIWGIYTDKKLEERGIILNAKTLEWVVGAKMGLNLQYEFYYNNKKIISDNAFGDIRGNRDFEGKYFPVIYDTILGSCELLIEPSDFEKFNIPF